MEQSDLSGLQVFSMLPSSVSSRMPTLRSFESLKRAAGALRRSRSYASTPYPAASIPTSANPSVESIVVSEADSSDVTEASASTSTSTTTTTTTTTATSLSTRSMTCGSLDVRKRHFDAGTVMEPQQNRLPNSFDASSYEAINQRWTPSGIKWRYARQGAHLTSIASEEVGDPGFERRSYIDGVAYFLKACPDNLTDLEKDILTRSSPWIISHPRPKSRIAIHRPTDRGKTFLHRTVRWGTALAVVVLHWLWCFLLVAGRVGARYERDYNISTRLMSQGYVLANTVGRHSVVLSSRIYAMGDGRVGQIVTAVAAWTMDSFAGGLQEGFGDGIGMITKQQEARASFLNE